MGVIQSWSRSTCRSIVCALLFAIVPANAFGQKAKPAPPVLTFHAAVEDGKLASTLMGREMPYRVVLPYHWNRPRVKRPVIYLLHGLTGHFNNWTDLTKLQEYASKYGFIIVTPEGEDGWYTDSFAKPNDKYESYIIKELIPEIEKKFGTAAVREHRAVAGLSMGGYGAIKFGAKYPEMFTLVGSFSGALNAASLGEKEFPGAIGKTISRIFGPAGSEARRANDLFDLIRRITPERRAALPFIYLDCGTEDFLFPSTRDFVDLLLEKGIRHEFRQLPGGHNWTYWEAQVQEFLELSEQHFKKNTAPRS